MYFAPRYFPKRYFGGRYFGSPDDVDLSTPLVENDYQLVLNGTLRKPLYGWEVVQTVNAQSTMRFDILSGVDELAAPPVASSSRHYFGGRYFGPRYFGRYFGGSGSAVAVSPSTFYRPSRDESVALFEDGEAIFGGFVTQPREVPLISGEASYVVRTAVTANDYKLLTRRRFLYETIPVGTLKSFLERIVTYLPGIVVKGDQADGPTVPEQIYDYVQVETGLNALTTMTGYVWDITPDGELFMEVPGAILAPFDVTTSNDVVDGDIEVEPVVDKYANRVIGISGTLTSIANDLTEQATKPVEEVVLDAPEGTDQLGLDAMVQTYLIDSVVMPRKIEYKTLYRGLKPGMVQLVQSAKRNLNDWFFITEVRITRTDGKTWRTISAIEGTTYRSDLTRDTYKQWSGGGGTVTVGGGTPTAGAVRKFAYPLAAVGVQGVRSATPTWVDAPSAIHVQISTTDRGVNTATIKARLKVDDVGNSVQARLVDVSAADAPVTGVSTVITSTTWSPLLSWAVGPLTDGHVYKLQLLPGQANKDVYATAYLE